MKVISFSQVLRFVWNYFRRFPLTVGLAYGAMTVTIVMELLYPLLQGWLVDTITVGISNVQFTKALWIVFFLFMEGVIYHTALRVAHFLNCYSDSRVERLVAAETLNHVQHLSSDWHTNSFAGSIVTKIKRAMRATHAFYDIICYDLYPTVGIVIGLIILISIRQWTLGLIFGLFALAYTILSITLAMKYVAPANRAANTEDSKLGGILADTLSSNATVKSFAGEKRESQYFDKVSKQWMHVAAESWMRGNIMALLQNILNNVLKVTVLMGSVWFWYQGRFSAGDVAFIFSGYMQLTGYLRSIGDRIRDLNQSINDMEDVIEIWMEPRQIKDRADAKKLNVKEGGIVFEKIQFRYEGQKHNLFENFSLTIHPGEKIALVGHSGSGKSTFVKLIQRLYDLDHGKILIDGQNIKHITQKSLRANIGLVPQDPILFHRSLAENIAYGQPYATQEQIEAAAKKAHAHEFIQRLQLGYQTLVGERGIKLSGGERQRVAIARAILADTPILILDEATSSLDSASEKLIQDALVNLMKKRTSIMIAHRLSTIKSADRILVFEHGKIVEEGKHSELVKKTNGVYRRLYELQAGGFLRE